MHILAFMLPAPSSPSVADTPDMGEACPLISSGEMKFEDVFNNVEKIPPILVDTKEMFAEELFEEAEPVIIKGSVVTTWPASKKWNPQYFIEAMPNVDVHMSREPIARMHTAVHPMGRIPGITWTRPWANATIPTKELFSGERITENSCKSTSTEKDEGTGGEISDGYPYYFSPVKNVADGILSKDIGEIRQLAARFRKTMETNLWMAPKGVGSPLHYDIAHNMYCQISGEKRFRMFPPQDHSNLYLFPRVHPSTRSSQVHLDHVQTENFPRFKEATPWEAVLKPGDVLYIPPYWFHATEVVSEASISVSICSESEQVELRESVFLDAASPSISFSSQFSHRVTGLVTYMKVFLETSERLRGFTESLHHSRFARLSYDQEVSGLSKLLEMAERVFWGRMNEKNEQEHIESEEQEEKEMVQVFRQHAETIKGKYKSATVSAYRYTDPEWEIELANHFEDIIAYVLESPLMIPPMLDHISRLRG